MEEIFKWFTVEDDVTVARLSWFADTFDVSEFEGVQALFVLFLRYCRDLGIIAKGKYLSKFLDVEGKKLIKKYKIRTDTLGKLSYDEPTQLEEAYRVVSAAAAAEYEKYMAQDLSERLFQVDIRGFMEKRKRERTMEIMMKVYPDLADGGDTDEVLESLSVRIAAVQETYDLNHLEELDFMTGQNKQENGREIMRHLFKTGIPCIDGDIGGMFSKQLWSLSALPGSGKTRLALVHFAYQAAVKYKLDVLFDELEMSTFEVENILIAYHIITLYSGRIKIPDKLINSGNLTEEQKRYVEAARIDLFETEGKYGKIRVRDKGLVLEQMESRMRRYLKQNPNTQLWIIDYAGLISSAPSDPYAKHLIGYEIIEQAYVIVKRLVKLADIGALILNQFNEKGIDAARAGKRIDPGHVQGGQVISRHSDYDLAMCMTEQQEIAQLRSLSTIKKRAATGFQNALMSTDMSVSIFRQMVDDSVS